MKLAFILIGFILGLGSYYAYDNLIASKPTSEDKPQVNMDNADGIVDSIDNKLKSVVIIDENDARSFFQII